MWDTQKIRELNDELRQHLIGGGALITPGVAALGEEAVKRLVRALALFDDFCRDNDPYGEHDFGAFDFDSSRIFFKIDYYNNSMDGGSLNPANPDVTERVITIMLAEEY